MRIRPGVTVLLAGLLGAALVSAACGSSDSKTTATTAPSNPQISQQTAVATATARPVKDVILEGVNEAYRSRATYQAAITKVGQVEPFVSTLAAENTVIDAWKTVLEKNGIPVPVDIFAGKITPPKDLKSACVAGVAALDEESATNARLAKDTTNADALKVMNDQQKAAQSLLAPLQKCSQ